MSFHFQLSRLEYDIIWEYCKLGPKPVVLELSRSHGRTSQERRMLADRAWESLRAKGLLNRPGRLDDDVTAAFTLLCQPKWEIDARLRLDPQGPPVKALAAAHHQFAVLAILDQDHLTVEQIFPEALASAVVSLLPAHPARQEPPVRLPAGTLDDASREAATANELATALQDHAELSRAEAFHIADVLSNVVRMGTFGAAYTPPQSRTRRERASYVVTFYDTPQARYDFSRIPHGGGYWCTLQPTDHTRLTNRVAHMLTLFPPE